MSAKSKRNWIDDYERRIEASLTQCEIKGLMIIDFPWLHYVGQTLNIKNTSRGDDIRREVSFLWNHKFTLKNKLYWEYISQKYEMDRWCIVID